MRFIVFLIKRFFFSTFKSSSLLVSIISFIGVFLGVFTLVLVLGIMQGFDEELKKRILDVQGHIAVFKFQADFIENPSEVSEKIRNLKGIKVIAPFISQEVLIIKDGEVTGTLLRGIDAKEELKILNLNEGGIQGNFSFKDGKAREIILGKTLAENLNAKLGDYVTLASPKLSVSGPLGNTGPRFLKCKVTAIVDLGLYQFNNNISYISLENARSFFKMKGNSVSGLSIQIDNPYNASIERLTIQRMLGGFPYITSSWQEINSNLFEAIAMERFVMLIILIIILIVASFSIISTLIIMVIEKMRTIGILGAMGISSRKIQLIFLATGLFIGMIGTALGIISGLTTGSIFSRYDILNLPVDIYWIEGTPFHFPLKSMVYLVLFSMVVSFLASSLPAWWVSKQDPMKAIRYG
ncbi:MAG: ABC transporter permease [Candidatus Coatesbacteria bacterium]|nr:ABC transporter permease [Candidatus Coatesbacteria bacterium]